MPGRVPRANRALASMRQYARIVLRIGILLLPARRVESSPTGTSSMCAPRRASLARISALQAKPGSRISRSP